MEDGEPKYTKPKCKTNDYCIDPSVSYYSFYVFILSLNYLLLNYKCNSNNFITENIFLNT